MRAQETALSNQTKILELKKQIKQANAELAKVMTTYPFDIDKYLIIKRNIKGLEEDLGE